MHDMFEITVSLPMKGHTAETLRNLINLFYARSGLLNKALGTSFRVDEGLVNALRDDSCVLNLDKLFETVEAYEGEHDKAADGLTIEPEKITFSTLPATNDPAILRTFTTLCAMMNKQALTQKHIRPARIREENERFSMRVWLLRMGMVGPEYGEDTRILMQRLSGEWGPYRSQAVGTSPDGTKED